MSIITVDDNSPGLLKHQEEFAYSKSMNTYLAAGWMGGKTRALLEFFAVSMKGNPGCQFGFIEPDFRLARQFVNNKFIPFFRKNIVGESRQDNEIHLVGNRKFIWISGHNLEKLEQYEFAAMGGDEVALMSGELVLRCAARVRSPKAKRLRIGYVGTPHYGWLKEAFDGKNDSMHRIIHASTLDNHHVPKEAVENLLINCPAKQRRAYIDGYFVPPGGNVYSEFDESVHVIDWQFRADLETGCAIDWSPFTPAVLFVQKLPCGFVLGNRKLENGGMVIFDELHPDGTNFGGLTTERLCLLIKAKNYPLHFAVVDPAGKGTQATSGTNEIAIARQHLNTRIVFTEAKHLRLIQNGIEHVQRMLAPIKGDPMLYFSSKLLVTKEPRAVLNAIRSYAYPKAKDGEPLDNDPVKDGISDHSCDCVRYLAINFFPVVRLQTRVRSIA